MERELLRAILLNQPALRDLDVDRTLFAEGLNRAIFDAIEADWRATPAGEPTPIDWGRSDATSGDPDHPVGPEEEIRLTLVAIASDQSEPGDPRLMVIRCRREALGREAASIRAQMGRIAADDPRRDELLQQFWQLERRRQELTGDLR